MQVGLALPGQELPAGWSYVLPEHNTASASVEHMMVGHDFPASFADMAHIANGRQLNAMLASQSKSLHGQQRYQSSSAAGGFGVTSVGALLFDDRGNRFAGSADGSLNLSKIITKLKADGFVIDAANVPSAALHFSAMNQSSSDRLIKMACLHFLGVAVNRSAFDGFIRNNILFPMRFIIARPYATYRTRILIKLQSRGGAGRTYIGNSSAEIGQDVSRMIGLLHYTTYIGAIIDKPQNVFVQPDLYIDRYYGGLGVKFFNRNTHTQVSTTGNTNSIIVLPIPYNENTTPNPMDVAGRWYTVYNNEMIGDEDFETPHYSTLYRMNNIYKFVDTLNMDDEFDTPLGSDSNPQLNHVMWQGMTWRRTTGKYDIVETNTGHHGPDVYTNVGKVRAGATQYVEPQHYSSKFSVK
jgi:hypothetical protein